MAFVVKDRVRETCSAPGTGTVTLLGAVLGYVSFSVIGNGNTTYYCIADQGGSNWEVGLGTYTSSGTTLSRDTVLSNSAGTTAKINFSSGTQDVFCTYPADYAAFIGKSIPIYTYDNRNALRSLTPDNNQQALIDSLGLFVFQLGSTDIDDDESCFATATGRWLLQAASFDLVEARILPRESLEEQGTQVAYGSGVSTITTITSLAVASFNISVPNAQIGGRVLVTPPNDPAAAGAGYLLSARLSYYGIVSAQGVVTVYIANPSAGSASVTANLVFNVAVFNPT